MKSVRADIGGLGNLMFKNAYIWAQMREGKIPDVYVQSEKYWEKYKDEIKQLYGHGIGHIDRVALHIRRGDYLKAHQFHRNLWDTNYYKEAIKMFPSDTQYLVFCKDNQNTKQDDEDRSWCTENLIPILGENFEMWNHSTETDDLNVMASCKGLIGANSSFSWWSAYLGNAEIKVFPDERDWFTDGVIRCEVPKEWTSVRV